MEAVVEEDTIEEIANTKMPDLTAANLDAAKRTVEGSVDHGSEVGLQVINSRETKVA